MTNRTNSKSLEFYEKFWPDLNKTELLNVQAYDQAIDTYLRDGSISNDSLAGHFTDRTYQDFICKYNSPEANKKALGELKQKINTLRPHPEFRSYLLCFEQKIPILEKYRGKYLITSQLFFLKYFLDEIKTELNIISDPLALDFSGFVFTEEQAFERIRKKTKWHNVERDITIFEEKPFYTLRQLAKRYGIKYNSISMIISKVQGSISEIIGTEFEKFILKKLRDSKLFERVERKAGTGEPDVLAYKNDSELFIYSLKCLKLESTPYWLIKNELRPELEHAKLCSLDYEIHLILLVFDSFSQKSIQIEIDYNNPENIELTKFLK